MLMDIKCTFLYTLYYKKNYLCKKVVLSYKLSAPQVSGAHTPWERVNQPRMPHIQYPPKRHKAGFYQSIINI